MTEPTRPLPSAIPLPHGGWAVDSFMSSKAFTLRGLALIPPNSTVPVIVVPGIMGTNLRAKRKPQVGKDVDERNRIVDPGMPAWRPPNGSFAGLEECYVWENRSPRARQLLLDPATLEVDDGGPIMVPDPDDGYVFGETDARKRGWGAVHAVSYGPLLQALQMRLNQTFGYDEDKDVRYVRKHWKEVMECDPVKWGVREFEPLTVAHLEKHAQHHFPVYCFGYNWLEDAAVSAERLEKRVAEIIGEWRNLRRGCDKVILVTHSMGGLVARACAKRIPDQIAGVIHGVMPALGAPVAYRRIACGTETSSPSSGVGEDLMLSLIAKVLGDTPQETTPVLATSPGALQLLPNHLYPRPWLHVRLIKPTSGVKQATYGIRDGAVRYDAAPYDVLHFPNETQKNPYDLYRNLTVWFRMVDPALADPAGKYEKRPDGIQHQIKEAIGVAEKFHRELGDYYHPETYVFYGADKAKLAFGEVTWVGHYPPHSPTPLTPASVRAGRHVGNTYDGQRRVLINGKTELRFEPASQESNGDGTVPYQSGAVPLGKVRQVFATRDFDHQGAYKNDAMLLLTLRLVVKIVQGMA